MIKLHRLIRDRVLSNDFEGACEGLCLIEMIKDKWDWTDVGYVWAMALETKSLKHVKVIIDILQMKDISDIQKI